MTKRTAFLITTTSILFAAATGAAHAANGFGVHDIYFELNVTADDVGLHALTDEPDWRSMTIKGPGGFIVIKVAPGQTSARDGLTELFFEGNEPTLDERSFKDLITLFPPGTYTWTGLALDNTPLRSTDVLTTVLPCPPIVQTPVIRKGDLSVYWRLVNGVYDPDSGVCSTKSSASIIGIEVTVELTDIATDVTRHLVVDLPPGATSVEVPDEFLRGAIPGATDAKAVVLVKEKSNNRTEVEASFDF